MNPNLYMALSIACVVLIVLCSIFVIIVVMMQKSNSDGISAITGSSETFYGKNKSKTLDSKLKRLTVICLIVIAVLCVLYFVLGLIPVA
jgi:preprotein translocase subunit SecG